MRVANKRVPIEIMGIPTQVAVVDQLTPRARRAARAVAPTAQLSTVLSNTIYQK